MGNSAPARVLTVEQQDLRYLGERFPLGDAEFRHLYRAYQQWLLQKTTTTTILPPAPPTDPDNMVDVEAIATTSATTAATECDSFWIDWGVLCGGNRSQLRRVEESLLPPHFGHALFRAGFLCAGDVDPYCDDASLFTVHKDTNNTTNTTNNKSTILTDEYTRKARLEQFFTGLASSSRRSSKDVLTLLFRTAQCLEQRQQRQQSAQPPQPSSIIMVNGSTTTDSTTILNNDSALENDTSDQDRVAARTFVELGYRLALAVAHFQNVPTATATDESNAERIESPEQQQTSSTETTLPPPAEQNKEEPTTNPQETTDSASTPTTTNGEDKVRASDTTETFTNSEDNNNYGNDDDNDDDNEASLTAMAHSIVEKGRHRRQRSGLPGSSTEECPHLQRGRVELLDILEWAEQVAPMFASVLPTLFQYWSFPASVSSPDQDTSRTLFDPPDIISAQAEVFSSSTHCTNDSSSSRNNNNNNNHNSAFFHSNRSAGLFALACTSPALTGRYYRLFTSATDGLSFNRLQNAVLGYGGPTLLLIRSTSGGVFGAYTATTWKESKDFYGNTDCFLFQLQPHTAVYRPTGHTERNFMYCNSSARSRGYDQLAHGMGFGGTVHEPRLFLTETLDDCVAGATDLTFDNGRLLPNVGESGTAGSDRNNQQQQQHRKYFAVESLEVWGVGGTAVTQVALQQREAARAVAQETIRRARKVDKAQFLDDFRTGTFASKAFQHRQEADGRANEDMDERGRDPDKTYQYS